LRLDARCFRLARFCEDAHGDIRLDAQTAREAHVALEVGARDELALDVGRRARLTIALHAHAAAPAGTLAATGGGDVLARLLARLKDALPMFHDNAPPVRKEGHRMRTLQRLGQPVQVQHDALTRRIIH